MTLEITLSARKLYRRYGLACSQSCRPAPRCANGATLWPSPIEVVAFLSPFAALLFVRILVQASANDAKIIEMRFTGFIT